MSAFIRPDTALLALRPLIPTDADVVPATPGTFLHHTLRPVLKLQNDLLLATTADFVRDFRVPLASAAPLDQQRLLAELLTRNTRLRATLIGVVTGQFTSDEFSFYRLHRPELNRRLLELATRRIQDQATTVAALSTEL